jgi:hypothetical protein
LAADAEDNRDKEGLLELARIWTQAALQERQSSRSSLIPG